MTQEATQIEVPNFEATTDGRKSLHRSYGWKGSDNIRNENTKGILRN